MKQVLITGCCGFIGSHLVEVLLKEGYEVHGIDNFDPFYSKVIKHNNLKTIGKHKKFKFFEADIREADFEKNMTPHNYDAVIHLAAKVGVQPSIDEVSDYIETNITGTSHVLNYMKRTGIKKMVFASSSSVYGNSKSIPFHEKNMANEPISPYAFTKRSCELLNYTYHHLYDFDIINLRLFTVYGPRQRPDLAIHKFVRNIDSDLPIDIYGTGETSRDYTYVMDIVTGFASALKFLTENDAVFETINLGNMNPIKLTDLLSTIAHVMNKKPVVNVTGLKPGDVITTYADTTYAKNILGYAPMTDLENGIKQFVEWYMQNEKQQSLG